MRAGWIGLREDSSQVRPRRGGDTHVRPVDTRSWRVRKEGQESAGHLAQGPCAPPAPSAAGGLGRNASPAPKPRGSRWPRLSVPVTCRRAAQSAPAARRLAIQTAELSVPEERSCRGRSRCCVRAMEHRIVGPGPYRATKLVSERAGAWAMLSAPRCLGLLSDRVLVSLRFSRAGRTRFGGGRCSGWGGSFLDVA